MATTHTADPSDADRAHRRRPMLGRDPHQQHRAATPLELLFDLTFVVAFGFAGNEFAHAAAEGHLGEGVLGFLIATFGITWAWINFSWFASAFDTDDWLYRLTTLLQMAGVIVFALGIHNVFASLVAHEPAVDNRVMVIGYVIMRVAMVAQWLRAAKHTPDLRRTCLTYAVLISAAQVGWLVQAFGSFSPAVTAVAFVVLILLEIAAPVIAETRVAATPWHPHHIAERYSLLVVVALGEGIVGSAASIAAAIEAEGWTWPTALVIFAGVAGTFGLWWLYFVLPSAEVLEHRRDKGFGWGYGHFVVFLSIAAFGAGLHVAGLYLEHHAELDAVVVVATAAVPVIVYVLAIGVLYSYLVETVDPYYVGLIAAATAVAGLSLLVVALGASVPVGLALLALAGFVPVAGFELAGYRHQARHLRELRAKAGVS